MGDAFQTIATICTIISFLLGVYNTLADNPEWQRYSLFGFAFLCIIVLLVNRKRKLGKPARVITLKGTQSLPPLSSYPLSHPHKGVEVEVFYPKLFKHTPNLTVRFPKRGGPRGSRGVGRPSQPEYRIIEQHIDGFRLQVLLAPGYEPIIEWQAKGQLGD